MFGLAALVLAFGLVFTVSAFKQKEPTNLAYQYTGDDDSGVMDPGNWDTIPYEPAPTECDAEGELVCIVQFNDEQFDDISDFLGNFADADAVNTSSYAKRHKEPVNR